MCINTVNFSMAFQWGVGFSRHENNILIEVQSCTCKGKLKTGKFNQMCPKGQAD